MSVWSAETGQIIIPLGNFQKKNSKKFPKIFQNIFQKFSKKFSKNFQKKLGLSIWQKLKILEKNQIFAQTQNCGKYQKNPQNLKKKFLKNSQTILKPSKLSLKKFPLL